MVKVSKALLKDAGSGLSKTLSEILVCPLSKQPLRSFSLLLFLSILKSQKLSVLLEPLFICLFILGRVCEQNGSIISDSIGVSFPVSCSTVVFYIKLIIFVYKISLMLR